jgi:RHS repeat-associated protein
LTPLAPVFAAEEAPVIEVVPEVMPAPEPLVIDEPNAIEQSADVSEEQPTEDISPKGKKDEDDEDEGMAAMSGGSGNPTGGKTSGAVSTLIMPEPDEMTGALNYAIPIVIPPGRNGLQPDLKLVYNNQMPGEGGFFGAGWSVPIPSIERVNRKGIDQLYSFGVFSSSVAGELVETASGTYKAKVEDGSFLTFSGTDTAWTATDRRGMTYTYGSASNTRQESSGGDKKFKWMLEEIRDANDNYVKYEYYKDQGQIYPSKIKYTGSGTSTDGIFEVEFVRASRSDTHQANHPGFPITTAYRISEIQAKISGNWIRKYALTYTTGANGVRSLLSSVTESGRDESGAVATLPATSFSYQTHDVGWHDIDATWKVPAGFINDTPTDQGVRLVDVNGDGRPDITGGYLDSGPWPTYLNNGANWDSATTSAWALPEPVAMEWNRRDAGTRFADLNGDTLVDVVRAWLDSEGTIRSSVYLNNGAGWTEDEDWDVPRAFTDWNGNDQGTRLADVNGDGLPDLMYTSDYYNEVYFNTGSGWSLQEGGTVPELFTSSYLDRGVRIADMNGDGLADIVRSYSEYSPPPIISSVYINTGPGWTLDESRSLPLPFVFSSDLKDKGGRLVDMNGDHLPDMILSRVNHLGEPIEDAYINTGVGWIQDTNWNPPESFLFVNYKGRGLELDDANGDGLVDFIYGGYEWMEGCTVYQLCARTYLNKGKKADLLSRVTYPQGGTTDVSYLTTQQHTLSGGARANTELPFVLDTVEHLKHQDGLGGAAVASTFLYEGGDYYYGGLLDRRYAGFSAITVTDAASNTEKTFFHQGNATDTSRGEYDDHASKIGRPYRTEHRDISNSLFSKTVSKWEKTDLGNGRNFAYRTRTTDLAYDGDSDHKDKTETYGYDTGNGNLTSKTEWGEVTGSDDGSYSDTGSDKRVTTISYVTSTGFTALPKQETVANQSGTTTRDVKFYYDAQSHGSATDGNLTKEDRWVSGGTWVNNQKTYNAYGLITQETDPRGKNTTYAYDANNLYPATVTNHLNHASQHAHDYSLGKPKQTTDPNGRVWTTTYDGFDRVLRELQPDRTDASASTTRTTYVYDDTTRNVSVKRTDHLDASTARDTWTYLDGLGRARQERKEAEDSNIYATRDLVYGTLGQLWKETLPYFSTGSASTTAATSTALYSEYGYDALKRLTAATNTLGVAKTAYDDWKVTTTDADGKSKDVYKDAYGQVVRVDERNGASTYTTTYGYDAADSLTSLTDALGNARAFTYDGLGRRLTAQDLHASSDATFGTWTYGYDNAGNPTSRLDPKGATLTLVYDDLNRLTSEDSDSASGTEAVYGYDAGTNGLGRLTSATSTGAVSVYEYDHAGSVKKETRIISGTPFVTQTAYDRQGNVTTLTNPDSSEVRNSYNTVGLLEKVERKESGGSWTDVIGDLDYAPIDKPNLVAYGNSATTTDTYDSTKLYRLTGRLTTIPGGSKAQDLSYTYSPAGNVTRIVDASNTDTAKTTDYGYDDLHRLTSATTTGAVAGWSGTKSWTYDAVGNITTSDAGSYLYQGSSGSSYANPHAATSVGGVTKTYDNNGNMTASGSGTFAWDWNNRLTQSASASQTASYTYDHADSRVKLDNGTVATLYPTKFYNLAGSATATKHVFAGNILVATVTTSGSNTSITYVHTDHLTGTSVVTSATGTLAEVSDYHPYGSFRVNQLYSGSAEQRKFAGHEYDTDSGLSYMGARYYDAGTGRFLSQDPVFLAIGDLRKLKIIAARNQEKFLINPQLLNSYAYSLNSPLTYRDPDGNSPVLAAVAGVLSVYGWISAGIAAYDFKTVVIDHPDVWSERQINQAGANLLVNVVTGGMGHVASGIGATISSTADDLAKMFFGGFGVFLDAVQNLLPEQTQNVEQGGVRTDAKGTVTPATDRTIEASNASKHDSRENHPIRPPAEQSRSPINDRAQGAAIGGKDAPILNER